MTPAKEQFKVRHNHRSWMRCFTAFIALPLVSTSGLAAESDVKAYYEDCVNRSASAQFGHVPHGKLVDRAFRACRKEEEGLRFAISQEGNRDSLEGEKRRLRDSLQRRLSLPK